MEYLIFNVFIKYFHKIMWLSEWDGGPRVFCNWLELHFTTLRPYMYVCNVCIIYIYTCVYGWMDGWMDGWTDGRILLSPEKLNKIYSYTLLRVELP
jgi:hypothetical protein